MAVIWVEGNMGAGKTRLTHFLSPALNLRAIEEQFRNPLFTKFSEDPKKHAFGFQMWMMMTRYALHESAKWESLGLLGYAGVCMDRGLWGDRVYAKMHYQLKNIEKEYWDLYEYAFKILCSNISAPKLLLILDVEPEICLERVRRRDRSEENMIDLEYLKMVRAGYLDLQADIESGDNAWSSGLKVKRIPWNVGDQDPWPIVEEIAHFCRLNIVKTKEEIVSMLEQKEKERERVS